MSQMQDSGAQERSHSRSASPQRSQSLAASSSGALQSCNFCRRRKIRCDGKTPCSNCEKRSQPCETAMREPGARTRPTKAAVNELEQQLTDLHAFIDRLVLATPEARSGLLAEWDARRAIPAATTPRPALSEHSNTATASPAEITATRQMHVAVDGQTSFHGHTSIFDHSEPQRQPHLASTRPAMTLPEEIQHAETVLSEAAASSRHQEIYDLAANRLDFDGIQAELAMELLHIHWHRQHHALLLTYRPAFMRDMATLGGGKYFSKLLLNCIYFGASKFSARLELRSDPEDPRTAGFRFLKRINELMGDSISRSSIPTIQALLLLASSLFALGQHQSSWLYSGLAFRMLVDMGLHVDNTAFDKALTMEDIEIRRRVVWGSFCFDKIHSLYQGRPPTLQEPDMHVPIVFVDCFEETEQWRPISFPAGTGSAFRAGVPTRSVSTFNALCRLCIILGRALNALYSFSSFSHSARTLLQTLTSLESDLAEFERNLPSHLRIVFTGPIEQPMPSNVLAFHALWTTLIIIVHRPFVEQGHHQERSSRIAENSWTRCIEAADRMSDILRIHRDTLGFRRAPFLISYCAYIAATIHVRIVAQRGTSSPAMLKLRFCMDTFRETETINTGVTRAKHVLLCLMDRLGVPSEVTGGSASSQPATDDMVSPYSSSRLQPEMDMDALFRSFVGYDPTGVADATATSSWPAPTGWSDPLAATGQAQDVLYGLVGSGNESVLDSLFRTANL